MTATDFARGTAAMADTDTTAERIAAITAREKAATSGPWERYEGHGPDFYANLSGSYLEGVGDLAFGEGEQADADRQFTLNARLDVPFLLAEVARLTAELAKYVGKEPTIAEEMQHLNHCLNAVYEVVDEAKRQGITSGGMFTVDAVEQAAGGDRPRDPDDRRCRLYLDGKGRGWIDASLDDDGTQWIACTVASGGQFTASDVIAETGSLREIGRTR